MTLPPSFSQAIAEALPCRCLQQDELDIIVHLDEEGNIKHHLPGCAARRIPAVLAALEPIWKAEIEAAEEAVVQDVSDEWIKRLRETTALAHDTFGKANLLVRATFQRGALARHDERTRRETLELVTEGHTPKFGLTNDDGAYLLCSCGKIVTDPKSQFGELWLAHIRTLGEKQR